MPLGPTDPLASGVEVGGGGDADVGDAEADCVGPAEADREGAVATAGMDESPWLDASGPAGPFPGVDVTVRVVGSEALAEGETLAGNGRAVGTAGAPVRRWASVAARPVGDAVDHGLGAWGRTEGPVVPPGVIGGRCDRLTAPTARTLIAMIAATRAVRTIHRVRRKPDFSVEISCSDLGGAEWARLPS